MQYKARVRTPAGRAKYGQEIGEVIVPDIPIGDIEFPKIGEVPEAQLIDNRLMFKPRDGSILDNKPNSDPYPVEWLYRAISDEEWDFINEHGYMQSDGRMNIAEGEGTVATPRDPTFYLPNRVGKRGRVVRIRYTPEDQWWVDHDGYAKTPAKIPIDRIDQVSPWYIAGVPMSDYTEDQLFYDAKNQLSNFVASMPDDYYEDPRPFHDFREPAWELTHSESPDEFYTALKDLADSSGNDVIQQFVTGLLDAVQSSREWMASVQEEKGIRRVRDPAFWGKPYGTRIVPGMKPVAQRPIPGIPPAPQPETPRDQRRVDSAFSWDRSEVRQNAMLVQSAIARAYDVDQVTTSPEEYANVFAVLQNYGIEFDEIEGDCNPLLTGDWVYFGECRTIRNAAYDVLGFGTEERTDADPYVYRPDDFNGPGVRHDVAAAKAWAILETLKDAPRSREPLYRGVNLDYVDFDAFTRYMHVGDTFDLPIASFANNKENAQRFGTSVVFKVERGARCITGGQMGVPESVWTSLEAAGETEWIDEDDTGFSEVVTGGRFKVTHWTEDPDIGSLIITIRQVGVFDPNTALVTKAPNERWKYAYLFDDSVRAHKHRTQKSRPRYRVQYKGIRRVRDPEYWGMPYNTPIVPGMKPKGKTKPKVRVKVPKHRSANPDPSPFWAPRKPKPFSAEQLAGGWTEETTLSSFGEHWTRKLVRQTRKGRAHVISLGHGRWEVYVTYPSRPTDHGTFRSLDDAKQFADRKIGTSSVELSKLHESLPARWKPTPKLSKVLKSLGISPDEIKQRYDKAPSDEAVYQRMLDAAVDTDNPDRSEFATVWTQHTYEAVQRALYTGKRAAIDKEWGIDTKAAIHAADSAFRSEPPVPEDMRVLRQTAAWDDIKPILQAEPGTVLQSKGFLATTMGDPHKIHGTHGMGRVTFDIFIPEGSTGSVLNLTADSGNEKELVINRKAKLVLLAKPRKGADGEWKVHLLLAS